MICCCLTPFQLVQPRSLSSISTILLQVIFGLPCYLLSSENPGDGSSAVMVFLCSQDMTNPSPPLDCYSFWEGALFSFFLEVMVRDAVWSKYVEDCPYSMPADIILCISVPYSTTDWHDTAREVSQLGRLAVNLWLPDRIETCLCSFYIWQPMCDFFVWPAFFVDCGSQIDRVDFFKLELGVCL